MNNKYLAFLILAFILTACSQQQQGAAGGSLRITTNALPNWESGKPSTFAISVTGGTPPYAYSIIGALPEGFNLGPAGVIGGSATLPSGLSTRTYPGFTIAVTDSAGNRAQQPLAITVVEPSIEINTLTAHCTVNQNCDELIATAEGGNPPYSFQSDTFREGAPPMGMIVDINGHIKGTTRRAGQYVVGVCAKDTNGNSKCGHATIIVEEASGLEGTWKGGYSETEHGPCDNKNEGTLTWIVTSSGDTFSGTVEDDGTTISSSCENSELGSYQSPGTVSGTISNGKMEGTMDFGFKIQFSGTISGNEISCTYNGGDSEYTYTGTFTLEKQ